MAPRARLLVSVHGVRYTTARDTAQVATDLVFRVLGHATPPPCHTADTPLPGGEMPQVAAFEADACRQHEPHFARPLVSRLVRTYGTRYGAVLEPARATPALVEPLAAGVEVTGAEIIHAVRHESALTLTDALIRRTETGSAGHPGEDAIRRAATLMAAELQWDAARTEKELDTVRAFYTLPA